MQPLIHQYNQDINLETTNIEKYCPVSGEALLFLFLENNHDYWVDEFWIEKEEQVEQRDIGNDTGILQFYVAQKAARDVVL